MIHKIKLEILVNSDTGLNELSKAKNLPFLVSWKIAKIIGKILPEVKAHEIARQNLIREIGEQSEDKLSMNVPQDRMKIFEEKMKELGNQEIELEFEKINMEDLKNITIEPKDLVYLDWLIQDYVNAGGGGGE